MSDLDAIIRWYLALTVVTALLAPVAWWIGAGLGASRHALLRPLGLLLVTFMTWWPGVIVGLPVTRVTLFTVLVLAGLAAWIVFAWHRGVGRLPELARSHGPAIVTFELVWLATFAGYLWFRSYSPDIANTEKPMEIALLSAVSRSADVPATDPWFAGEPINYYYFGYQMLASLVKLTAVPPSMAFNLGLATIFASAATVASGIGAFLGTTAGLRRYAAAAVGALAAFFLLIAGNLETAVRLVRDPRQTIEAGWWDGIGWNASRIIYDRGVHGNPEPVQTINEFPAFSFVLGDLHPHVLTYPFLLSVVGIALGFLVAPSSATRPRVLVAGGIAGVLYASNSWDAPLAVAVLCAALVVAVGFRIQTVWQRLLLVAAGAIVAAIPFAIHYTAPFSAGSTNVPEWFGRIPVLGTIGNTLALVTWRPSSVSELLTVHGAWLAVFVLFAAWVPISQPAPYTSLLKQQQEVLVVAAIILIVGAVAWAPAMVLLGVPLIASGLIVARDRRCTARIVGGLFFVAFLLALIPEFAYIQDAFGNRMNTVFKLYFQAWIFFSIASAVAIGLLLHQLVGQRRIVAGIGVLAVILAVLPYAPLSVEDWIETRPGSPTIDGAAYLSRISPGEAAAIDWLSKQANDQDVIVESPGCGYGSYQGVPMNRFSAFTGVPTVLGWSNHESQWRRGQFNSVGRVLQQHQQDANRWLDGNPPSADGYDQPRFIVIGPQETIADPQCASIEARGPEAVQRLRDSGWTVAFERGNTHILVPADDPLASTED